MPYFALVILALIVAIVIVGLIRGYQHFSGKAKPAPVDRPASKPTS